MSEEPEADLVFLDLQNRVAEASRALLDHVAADPGREWTGRELVDALWRGHGCRPAVVGIAIDDLVKRGSLKRTAHLRIQGVPKTVAGLAV